MTSVPDPFSHHPELRGKIADPLQSFMRTTTMADLALKMQALGLPIDWWHSDAEREAMRAETLAGRLDTDLWVFAYGSLMWDPAIRFAEVLRGYAPDYARRFILRDTYGGRGTRDAPGLMAALDHGPGCHGLLFRVTRDLIDVETEILWRREKIGPAYVPTFVDVVASGRTVTALTFVADHDSDMIDAGISRDDQIRFLATGTGFFGSSLEYLTNIADHFVALGIEDAEVSALAAATRAYLGSL